MIDCAEVQHISSSGWVPEDIDLQNWTALVLKTMNKTGTVVIRLVDESESQQLNSQYRHKNSATNVLSFPFEAPEIIEDNHLGDLVICVAIVNCEADEQGKAAKSHWAHMVIHGMLHLLGYDHITDEDAQLMEQQEITFLQRLGVDNPYETEN